MLDINEKFDTPPLKPTNQNWTQFQRAQLTPYKTMHAFSQARDLYPQTYSLSLPLEWSQVTHIPTSIKSGRAYKPEKSAFHSTCFQDGSLPFLHTHKHASPLRQVLHTQIAITFNELENLFSVKCWRISSKFCQATTKSHRPHQRDTPPCWFQLCESVNKPTNFNCTIIVTWLY